ncbi:hypothetical protein [Belnapia moabensis]|uniref:hypothetical protein n=1 Tax=Belnapia moabensis TaxID=365533 RepID=UPI000694A821|nr:hypothetical protein [Belnapia moabensis]
MEQAGGGDAGGLGGVVGWVEERVRRGAGGGAGQDIVAERCAGGLMPVRVGGDVVGHVEERVRRVQRRFAHLPCDEALRVAGGLGVALSEPERIEQAGGLDPLHLGRRGREREVVDGGEGRGIVQQRRKRRLGVDGDVHWAAPRDGAVRLRQGGKAIMAC